MPDIVFIIGGMAAALAGMIAAFYVFVVVLELIYQTLRAIGLALNMLAGAAWWALTALPRLAWFLARLGWRLGRAYPCRRSARHAARTAACRAPTPWCGHEAKAGGLCHGPSHEPQRRQRGGNCRRA